MQPYISFIIPVYQGERFLSDCIESIISYKGDDIEIIIVNDGSTDKSREIINYYKDFDNRIIAIEQQNAGVSAARNVALNNASGKWIWFVDADDTIVEGSISYLKAFLSEHICDTVFSGLINIWSDRQEKDMVHSCCDDSKSVFLNNFLVFQNGAILFSNDIIQTNNLRFNKNIRIGEDLEFQIYYLMVCNRPVCSGICVYNYNHRSYSAMTNDKATLYQMNDNMSIVINLIDYISKNKIKNQDWLVKRINLFIKSSLQAASLLTRNQRGDLLIRYKQCLNSLFNIGFANVCDKTLILARFFPAVYFYLIKKKLK